MRLINQSPARPAAIVLMILPFAALAIAYAVGSEIRLAANPQDKLLPAPSQIWDTAVRLFTEGDRRTGRILLWYDTGASLGRLAIGVAISALSALVFGMAIGMLPYARRTLGGFVGVISMVPPLAILPILFIIFGLGEVSKVALIVVGITPVMIRDLSARTLEIPREMIVKAETLGASSAVIALRVVLPQILPRLISSIRLSLGPAWLFLIAAEAIAAQLGLGYRIFLVRRYLAMDVILTYVIWITLLAFVMDYALRLLARKAFPWTEAAL
ncbi:ABC transporter permease [Pseudooceanicola algae]|uniref:Aliphatic sulfonates transport permease protein SsuC n=1 Tax=Pseudooceanicola algae TaxID=1537215 RepID=A0A418SGX6_9RHOB|nr:ABC transporter permease [Pseudooceanicola algae]QPM88827.1 Putative aliphatic sulfonates transport permease protein SsuC [Pseudooceanicola algae]